MLARFDSRCKSIKSVADLEGSSNLLITMPRTHGQGLVTLLCSSFRLCLSFDQTLGIVIGQHKERSTVQSRH